jgi:hypothetical protein
MHARTYIHDKFAVQRIKELGASPDMVSYVWDGGSSQEYVALDHNASASRAQTETNLALSSLSHGRLAASSSALDSPGDR